MIIILTIAFGFFIFYALELVLGIAGEKTEGVHRRLKDISLYGNSTYLLEDELKKPLSERVIKPLLKQCVDKISKLLPENSKNKGEKEGKGDKLRTLVRQSGMKVTVETYRTTRFLIILGTALLSFIIGVILKLSLLRCLVLVLIAVYGAYVILRFQLTGRVTRKRALMEKQLPDILDMLSVSVEAGLGFEQALIEVANHFSGPLIDELVITNREITMGRDRKEALLSLGERCDFEEMNTFVRAVVQAMSMGVSIKSVLHSQAAFMRQTRRNKIEEKAMKVSVKILLPMAFFIFPVIFIILLAPALINIVNTLM